MGLLPQTQVLVPNLPIGSLIAGFNNQQLVTTSLIVGSYNKVIAPFSNVTGTGNTTNGQVGSALILGSDNSTEGTDNQIVGSGNVALGDNISISGNQNEISGVNVRIEGNNNITNTDLQQVLDVKVVGNNNLIKSSGNISGNNNQIGESYVNLHILGDENILLNTIIYQDDSGFTQSNPTQSVIPPYSITASNIYISGSQNVVDTTIQEVHIHGNGVTASTSNRFIVAPNLEVEIQNKVLPCDLIQDYTPNGLNDPTGVKGWVTKDVDNIYVKTSVGWRIIPFNNTYGNFYDTSTQASLTASTPLPMKFNSTQVSSDVSIQSGSHIVVNWDGVYNLQFSSVFESTNNAAHDVDIWFRYNGTDIPYSNTRFTIGGKSKSVSSWNYVYSMTASSYMQIMWASNTVDISMTSYATQSQPFQAPAIPSVILTVDKISSL